MAGLSIRKLLTLTTHKEEFTANYDVKGKLKCLHSSLFSTGEYERKRRRSESYDSLADSEGDNYAHFSTCFSSDDIN